MNYAAAICYFPKITYVRARNLLTRFSDPQTAFFAELDDLVQVGFSETIAHEFMIWREKISVEKITEDLASSKIQTVSIFDDTYPILLKEITDPPPVLFFRGNLPDSNKPSVSVVGTRRCSIYGKQITRDISSELAENGVVIVSGLALGIDGIAHEATLAKNGITVAVLGSGVDRRHVYPSAHQPLAERIIENGGAIISEYPPNFEPTQYSFPARNRIIAGLTMGTIITEAPLSSGALITAERCLDYNRDIFAVPHPVTSIQGAGGNKLLKKGAILVTEASDILEALEIQTNFRNSGVTKNKPTIPTNPQEASIFSLLETGPKHVDEIIKESGLESSKVMGTLTILEMSGKVVNNGGMTYVLR
ncbi:MAG: DNA-processing protein DprA [Patescibacteria group bacterium]|jgi:DNA processing protein